ncbi:MAG: ABC transporter substrate-binding protein [Chloroflexota bacterium]
MLSKHYYLKWLLCLLFVGALGACSPAAEVAEPAPETTSEETAAEVEAEPEEVVEEEESEAEMADRGVIKIGLLAPLTGPAAADGEEMVRGAELAIEELNTAGGIAGYTFELVVGDVQDQSPDAVVSAIESITADEAVNAMMTGYASTTNFEIELMAEMDMPYLISANAAQTEEIISQDPDKYSTVWSLVPSFEAYETELPRLMEAWAEAGHIELNNRKVAIVTSDNPYSATISEGLKESFAELGWEVTVDETVPFAEVLDWRTILAEIRQDPPDLIVNTDYQVGNEVSFLEQFMEDPTDSMVFMQYGPSIPEFVELTADSSTGVIYNLLGGMILTPENAAAVEFIEKFNSTYGVDPSTYGNALYESVYIYAEALESIGDPTERAAVGSAIGDITWDGATGTIAFDPETHLAIQGDDNVPIQFYQLDAGERILIHPPGLATGDIAPSPWQAE